MKVLSIKGNKVKFDMSEEEYNLLLRDGLQKWINKKVGPYKLKVLPIEKNYKPNKNVNTFEIEDDFSQELINLAVIEALKLGIKKDRESEKNKRTKYGK